MADRVWRLVRGRCATVPAWVLVTQLFIGLGWIRAATEKLISSAWWRGDELTSFLANHHEAALGWYRPVIDHAITPNLALIAVTVVIAQAVAGWSLLTGRHLGVGLGVGMFLNLNFVANGAVAPSAFYLLSQGAIALWLVDGRRTERARRQLTIVSIGAGVLALASIPFIATLAPAEVIDDPAIMLVTSGVLAVLGCELTHARSLADASPAAVVESRHAVTARR